MTDARSNRRELFTRAWREALASRLGPFEQDAAAPAPAAETTSAVSRPMISAGPTDVWVPVEELLEQAEELGLAGHAGAIRGLASESVRLTPVAPGMPRGRSRLGGRPDLTPGQAWPDAGGFALPFVAQVDLADIAALGVRSGLPDDGLLLFFCAADYSSSEHGTLASTDARALVVPAPDGPADAGADIPPGAPGPPLPAVEVRASVELSLPRVWSARVEALGLDVEEQASWQHLRAWLGARQGVQLHDVVDEYLAVQRLFGYPDERSGEMPLLCELLAAGEEVQGSPCAHPLAGRLEPLASRWTLLLQLSADETLGWRWSNAPDTPRDRLCFWVDRNALAAGDVSDVYAITQ